MPEVWLVVDGSVDVSGKVMALSPAFASALRGNIAGIIAALKQAIDAAPTLQR